MVETKKKSSVKKTVDKSVKTTKKTDVKVQKKIAVKSKKTVTKVTSKATKKVDKKLVKKTETKKEIKINKKKTRVSDVNLWKISSIILVIVVLFLAVVIGLRFFNGSLSDNTFEDDLNKKVNDLNNPTNTITNTNNNDNTSTPTYELLIVEDSTCGNCNVDYFADQIKANLIKDLVVTKIEYSSHEGQIVTSNLGIKIAPVFLFSKSIDLRDDWEKLENVLIPVNIANTDFYLLNPMVLESKILIEDVILLDSAVVIGNPDAKVTLVEFSDFECPVCAIMKGSPILFEGYKIQNPEFTEATIPKVFEKYIDTGLVKYVFYNFPIDRIHSSARKAHNAALCANEQEQFKAYSDILYSDRESWVGVNNTEEVLIEFAQTLDLSKSQFKECLTSQKYNTQIDKEIELALPYGVAGTPTYFVNKQVISGIVDFETFSAVIESELEKSNN